MGRQRGRRKGESDVIAGLVHPTIPHHSGRVTGQRHLCAAMHLRTTSLDAAISHDNGRRVARHDAHDRNRGNVVARRIDRGNGSVTNVGGSGACDVTS